jgi:hypothetical protein
MSKLTQTSRKVSVLGRSKTEEEISSVGSDMNQSDSEGDLSAFEQSSKSESNSSGLSSG